MTSYVNVLYFIDDSGTNQVCIKRDTSNNMYFQTADKVTIDGNCIVQGALTGTSAIFSSYIDAPTINPSFGEVKIATNAGLTNQGLRSVAIGDSAGQTSQGANSVAMGASAGFSSQGANTVAVGVNAGSSTQGSSSVAIGNNAGRTNQGTNAVAIGSNAGFTGGQGSNAVAVGSNAGNILQGSAAVAIGVNAGRSFQGASAVAIGSSAGQTGQGLNAVAIGPAAATTSQNNNAVAIGSAAGQTSQGINTVAIGLNAGQTTQGNIAVAIGSSAGQTSQGGNAVAVGIQAGQTSQGTNAVAVGAQSGQTSQGAFAIAIGQLGGQTGQGSSAIAIGNQSGRYYQNTNAIAIGNVAGLSNQHANTIILNASGIALNSDAADRTFVRPIRNTGTSSALYYNPSTYEISYGAASSGGNVPIVTTSTITIGGATTAPTKATSPVRDWITIVDDGSGWCMCTYLYDVTTSTAGSVEGSGVYFITLPGGYQFDSTYYVFNTGSAVGFPMTTVIPSSTGYVTDNTVCGTTMIVPRTSTTFTFVNFGVALQTNSTFPNAATYFLANFNLWSSTYWKIISSFGGSFFFKKL